MDVKSLVAKVLEGDVRAAQPLIDRLQEQSDSRVYNLLNFLTDLSEGYARQTEKAKRRRYRSPEEEAFRLDELRFSVWAAFAQNVAHLFYYEINGLPDLAFLKTIGTELSAPRQAARFAEAAKSENGLKESVDPGDYEGEGNMGGMPPRQYMANRRYAE